MSAPDEASRVDAEDPVLTALEQAPLDAEALSPEEAEHFAALVAAGPGESKATSDVTGGLGTLGSVVFLVRMVLERP